MSGPRRFYKTVSISPASPLPEEEREVIRYSVLLDGTPVKTPMGAGLALPTLALAEAVANEWRSQGEKIMPATMHLTRLANTAIDRVVPDRRHAESEILNMARNDVVCYRADAPAELAVRQRAAWDPLLIWGDREYGATLTTGTGIGFIEQPDAAMAALRRTLAARDPFALTGLAAAATLCSSAILALALADGRMNVEQAFAASNLDADFQAELWGQDAEALFRQAGKKAELEGTASFMRLAGTSG